MWADAIKTFDLKLNENAEKERSTLSIQFVSGMTETPLAQSYEAVRSTIAANRELQQPGSERSTRHIEIELPEGMTYQEEITLACFRATAKIILIAFCGGLVCVKRSSDFDSEWSQCNPSAFRSANLSS